MKKLDQFRKEALRVYDEISALKKEGDQVDAIESALYDTYRDGHERGGEEGYKDGRDEGYAEGVSIGYDDGYEDGTADAKTTIDDIL